MGLRIATNIASQMVRRNLKNNSETIKDEYQKLSSGSRITKAADDAAGMAIGKKLEATTRGLRQATRNANDGISFVQTAEGGLSETSNILVRLRELTIQSASDTMGDKERELLDSEYQQLVQEVDRIAESTTFNGAKVISGDTGRGTLDFHVGAFGGEVNQIKFDSDQADAHANAIGVDGTGVATKEDANSSISALDEAIDKVSGLRAGLGAMQSRLQSTVGNLEVQTINQDQARSVIMDVDVAESTAKLAARSVMKQASMSSLVQANNIPNAAVRLIG